MSTVLEIRDDLSNIKINDRNLKKFEKLSEGACYKVYNFGVLEIYTTGRNENKSLTRLFRTPITGEDALIYKRINGRVEGLLNNEVIYIIQTVAELFLYNCNFTETKYMFDRYFLG